VFAIQEGAAAAVAADAAFEDMLVNGKQDV
jgi:hypothetical protein